VPGERVPGEPGSLRGEPPNACCTRRRAFVQRNFTVGPATPGSTAASACDSSRYHGRSKAARKSPGGRAAASWNSVQRRTFSPSSVLLDGSYRGPVSEGPPSSGRAAGWLSLRPYAWRSRSHSTSRIQAEVCSKRRAWLATRRRSDLPAPHGCYDEAGIAASAQFTRADNGSYTVYARVFDIAAAAVVLELEADGVLARRQRVLPSSVMQPVAAEWWLRPVRMAARVGEHSAVVW
jgi:hypothetical protein